MATPHSNRQRAARRAASRAAKEQTSAGQEEEATTDEAPVLTPFETDVLNIASAVQMVRATYSVNADVALKIVDLSLTARMHALSLKQTGGVPFPFTPPQADDTEGVEGEDGATSEAPLTEVEASET